MIKENKPRKSQYHKYTIFTGMTFQMGITIGAFSYLGTWLDEKYPNNYSAYTIVFSITGVFAALYAVIKQVIKISNEEE